MNPASGAVLLFVALLGLFAYVLIIVLSARWAKAKGHSAGAIVAIGIFFTPIVALIVAACYKDWNYVPPPSVNEAPPSFNSGLYQPDGQEELRRMRDNGLISEKEFQDRIK